MQIRTVSDAKILIFPLSLFQFFFSLSSFLSYSQLGMRIQFFSLDPDPAKLKINPDPTLIRNEEKNIYLYFR